MDSIKLFVPLIPGNSGRDSLPLSYIVPHKNLYVLENHNSKIFAVCRLGQQHKCGYSYIYSNLHNIQARKTFLLLLNCVECDKYCVLFVMLNVMNCVEYGVGLC